MRMHHINSLDILTCIVLNVFNTLLAICYALISENFIVKTSKIYCGYYNIILAILISFMVTVLMCLFVTCKDYRIYKNLIVNKNTFCGTRYLSHCFSLHGIVVAVT